MLEGPDASDSTPDRRWRVVFVQPVWQPFWMQASQSPWLMFIRCFKSPGVRSGRVLNCCLSTCEQVIPDPPALTNIPVLPLPRRGAVPGVLELVTWETMRNRSEWWLLYLWTVWSILQQTTELVCFVVSVSAWLTWLVVPFQLLTYVSRFGIILRGAGCKSTSAQPHAVSGAGVRFENVGWFAMFANHSWLLCASNFDTVAFMQTLKPY